MTIAPLTCDLRIDQESIRTESMTHSPEREKAKEAAFQRLLGE